MRSALPVAVALLLAACGSATGPTPGAGEPSGPVADVVDPDQELVAHGILNRDLPTQDELREAQAALGEKGDPLHLLHTGVGGVSGLLEVGVLVSDQETVDAVLEAVSPWLEPDQVLITGALRPLDG